MVIILRGGKSFLSFLVFLQHLLLKKQQMTKTSAYFSVFFEFFKIFQQMLINFFMALKYGIRAFERTWTRTKIFKTRFSMLCWSLKVRLIFRPFWLIFGQKNQKWQKYPPKHPKITDFVKISNWAWLLNFYRMELLLCSLESPNMILCGRARPQFDQNTLISTESKNFGPKPTIQVCLSKSSKTMLKICALKNGAEPHQ